MSEPQNIWMTSEAVIVDCGFDPFPHIEQELAPDRKLIRNKLIVRPGHCGACLIRVWLQDDVLPLSKKYDQRRELEKMKSLERRITAQYTKGLRK